MKPKTCARVKWVASRPGSFQVRSRLCWAVRETGSRKRPQAFRKSNQVLCSPMDHPDGLDRDRDQEDGQADREGDRLERQVPDGEEDEDHQDRHLRAEEDLEDALLPAA